MAEMKEPLIPKIGVVTDIRIDTPDVKTFRVVTPDGKKAFDHMPGTVRDAFDSGRWRGDVLHYLFSDQHRIHGILHQEVRLCDRVASLHGSGTGDHHPRSLRQTFPGGYRVCRTRPALHRRRYRTRSAPLGHQLLPPLSRPLRQDRHCVRLPQHAGSG